MFNKFSGQCSVWFVNILAISLESTKSRGFSHQQFIADFLRHLLCALEYIELDSDQTAVRLLATTVLVIKSRDLSCCYSSSFSNIIHCNQLLTYGRLIKQSIKYLNQSIVRHRPVGRRYIGLFYLSVSRRVEAVQNTN